MIKNFLLTMTLLMFSCAVLAADQEKGKRLVELNNCASCHGANLTAPIAPEYPKLAGQYSDYLFYAMLAYQAKNKRLVGRNHPIMVDQMAKFSRADLEDMAAYIASLPGDLVTKP